VSCGPTTDVVLETPEGTPRTAKGVRVPFPPPPAEIEVIPLRRRDECFWRDGFWQWSQTGWSWRPGAWELPPVGCTYTRPTTRWVKDAGTLKLLYFGAEWQPEEPGIRCSEPRSCSSLLPESQEKTHDPLKPNP
jgi:hypothetical protein